jgi:hypothetical protein
MDNLMIDSMSKFRQANRMMQRMMQSAPVVISARSQINAAAIASLSNELREIREGGLLESSPFDSQELSCEKSIYKDRLAELHKVLPVIHIQLRIKLSTLGQAQTHMTAVSGWLNTSKNIF